MPSKLQCFKFQSWLKTHIFIKGCIILPLQKNVAFLIINNILILSIDISGSKKQRPDMDMSNNYVLVCCFLWPCWAACFVVHSDYFTIKIMFEFMYRDSYLLYCSVWYIIRTDIRLSVIWYIAFVNWLSRIATTGVYVTLTPNSWQVWGYPHKIGLNKKLVPQFDFTPTL